jgi:hypothetical protein
MTFVTGPRVLVRQVDDTHWRLEEQVVYAGRRDTFAVPVGTRTDFASVPRVFAWLVPKYGRFTPAAVLHDHLVGVERPAGRVSARDADRLFVRAMRELGVPFLLRWYMWGAVRIGSLTDPGGRPGWVRDLPAVVLVLVAALPVVAVPAVAILVGLAVFAVQEFLVYGVLLAVRAVRPTDRQVNRPHPDLRT